MHTNPALVERFKTQLKIPIIQVWGSTETMGIALANPDDGIHKAGSIGKPCPYYQAKIVGEGGEELVANEIGEMAIKGPATSSGYFGNPEETKKCMKDGWFFTGDLVRRDSEGYFYFVARKNGMMKVAGMKVFPTEIEDVLSTHPGIAEVAVVKVRDRLHGEVPKAVIVLKEGAESDKAEIRKYSEKRMSKYKVPHIIELRTELPKTPGGKVLYREL
jgi:long-chain acyl-CoA synthetase